jgi:hypothetical protein
MSKHCCTWCYIGEKANARDSTAVADYGSDRGVVIIKALGHLKVGRVQVLRTMGEEVEAWVTVANEPRHPLSV